jgi:hypothetical protein
MSEDFDENRELCDDGNCLGVVVDGRCNVCGGGGGGLGAGPRSASDAASDSASDSEIGSVGSVDSLGSVDADEFDPDRALCPDGACTGLLGSDSKCKVCGRTP